MNTKLEDRAVKYRFGGHPMDAADFYVECRAGFHGDLWAVTQRGQCMERSGEWQWEPIPSNRDEDYYAAARYDRDTALAIASAIEAARGDRRVVNLPGSAQRTLNMYRSRGNAEAEWMALQALDKAAVLGVLAGVDVARCDVCDEPCDDLHAAVVDGENLDVCWKCCPDCPTKEAS